MRIDRLEISSLRNLDTVAIDPCPGLNFFSGANGSGKTSLLEAIYLVVRGRSFRSQRIQTVIAQDAESLAVRIVISESWTPSHSTDEYGSAKDLVRGEFGTPKDSVKDEYGTPSDSVNVAKSIGVTKDRRNNTQLSVDGERHQRVSAIAGELPIQTLLPNVSDLIFAGPGERREWLDWGLFHVKPDHINVMRRYRRLLKQRNQALKLVAMRQAGRDEVEVWTEPLIAEAETINLYRTSYLKELEPVFAETLDNLASEQNIGLEWRKGWPNEKELQESLVESYSRDVKLGATQLGPHRADLLVSVGGSKTSPVQSTPASQIVSRGQGKMIATALKLTQARHLAKTTGRRSIFLIDDVGAELDQVHGDSFFTFLERLESQIFATSTHPYDGDHFQADNFLTFHVEQGRIA